LLSLPAALHLHLRSQKSKDYRAKPGFLPLFYPLGCHPVRFRQTAFYVFRTFMLLWPNVSPALCGALALEYTFFCR